MICEKCGRDIKEGTIVCGYCGHSVPKENLSSETIQKLEENSRSDDSLKPNTGMSIRVIGIILMVVGGVFDLISIALVGSGSVSTFSTIIILGSICFFLGLILTFAFRG